MSAGNRLHGCRFLVQQGRILSLVLTLALAACNGGVTPAGALRAKTRDVPVEGEGRYTDVSAGGLAAMLKRKDFPLINVHVPYEGEIDGTDLFIPYDEIGSQLDKLPPDRRARVVLYCLTGRMSAIAARTLVERGYTEVWNLDGGTVGWKAAGYPLLDKRPSTERPRNGSHREFT